MINLSVLLVLGLSLAFTALGSRWPSLMPCWRSSATRSAASPNVHVGTEHDLLVASPHAPRLRTRATSSSSMSRLPEVCFATKATGGMST